MKQTLLTTVTLLIAIVVGAALAFAGGLVLMNVRADWALALGALICVAAPVLALVQLWRMAMEGRFR
ncbi:MAG: hypothetical protein ACREH4_13980 [Vitreimonas sp.]